MGMAKRRTSPRCSPCRVWRRPGPSVTAARRPMADIDAVYDIFVPKNKAVAARIRQLIPARPNCGRCAPTVSRSARRPDNARHHGRDHAGRGARALSPTAWSAPATRLRAPDAVHALSHAARSRGLAGLDRRQGRRHRGRHRRRAERRRAGRSASPSAATSSGCRSPTRGASAEISSAAARRPCSGSPSAGAHYVIDSVADLLPVLDSSRAGWPAASGLSPCISRWTSGALSAFFACGASFQAADEVFDRLQTADELL